MSVLKIAKLIMFSIILIAGSFGPPLFAAETDVVGGKEIAKLIADLGSPEFKIRDGAMKKLREIHVAADALGEAAKSHKDIEVRERAKALLEVYEKEKWVMVKSSPSAHPDVDVVGGLLVSRDGSTAFTRCRLKVSVWDLGKLKVTKTIVDRPHEPWKWWLANGPAYFMGLSPDGSLLATTDPVGKIYFHDLNNGFKKSKLIPPREVKEQRPDSKALLWHGRFFPKSKKFATSSDSSFIDIWDLETKKLIETLPKVSQLRGLTFEISPDEKFLIASFNQEHPDGSVYLWDFEKKKWSNPEWTQMITSFRFFSDGRRVLATGAKGSLYLFEVGAEGLKKIKTYENLGDYVANVVIMPGEKTAFVGMRTPLGEIAELDLTSGEVLWRSPPHEEDKATAERLVLLEDGRLLAMFATGEMTIWKAR